ncbi:MAG: molybdenum cofactor biosynthesis protein [Candidatus Cloacimonas sp. 4484_275]|nr:MAG: molybdenum cofactor biosynthesis protein [Candidatus Cloacimonas sp. 4484_275]RLC52215.1 MAG: MogA/MoaB family molybdenum cofactor biosynthesis protein [Candidatus Cloacimonadota bacterium]
MKVTVITISDRASKGIYEDLSGPKIEEILKEKISVIQIERIIVPDEKEEIKKALEKSLGSDFIITTGGTGISERDVTPEVTAEFCDKELPGIAELLRYESYRETPMAMLSRGYAGIKNKTIVVNFPGSVKAVSLSTKVLTRIMEHSLKMMRGEGH